MVTVVLVMQDLREKFLSKFSEICMETLSVADTHPYGNQHDDQKPAKTSVSDFLQQNRKFIRRGILKL